MEQLGRKSATATRVLKTPFLNDKLQAQHGQHLSTGRGRVIWTSAQSPKESQVLEAQKRVLGRAIKLRKREQKLAKELAQLQAEAEQLDEEQRAQVQAVLSAQAPAQTYQNPSGEPSSPSEPNPNKRKGGKRPVKTALNREKSKDGVVAKYRHFPPNEATDTTLANLPPSVQKALDDAKVSEAMPWEGKMATPTEGNSSARSLATKVEEFMMQAGKNQPRQRPQSATQPGAESSAHDSALEKDDIHDDEQIDGDAAEFVAGEGVDELVAKLERGAPLPPDPEYEGLQPETSEDYRARIDKLRHAYEAQFLDRKNWKITPEEFKEIWDAKLEEEPPPWEPSEISNVQPAPDWPEEMQSQYDRFQWILYLLRRAHMDVSPAAPANALLAAGLAADDLVFEDPVMESLGADVWQDYMQRLAAAGGHAEVGNIWGEMDEQRPSPTWKVYVDLWHNLPYPPWYQQYFEIHMQLEAPPNLGRLTSNASLPPEPFSEVQQVWEPPPLRYPKGQTRASKGFGKRSRKDAEAAEPEALNFMQKVLQFALDRSIPSPYPELLLPQEDVHRYLWQLRELQAASSARSGADRSAVPLRASAATDTETVGAAGHRFTGSRPWRGFQHASVHDQPRQYFAQRQKRRRRAGHRVVNWEPPEDKAEAEIAAWNSWRPDFGTQPAPETCQAVGRRQPCHDAGHRRLLSSSPCTMQSINNGEPVQSRVLTYADSENARGKKRLFFKAGEGPKWPEAPEVGAAWRTGEWLSIPMTVCYTIDNSLSQVGKVQTVWGAVFGHALGGDQDLTDLYMRQLQLYEKHNPQRQRIKVYRMPYPSAGNEPTQHNSTDQ